jgi:hypothetical protein
MSWRLAAMVDVYETDHTARHHDRDERFNEKTPDTDWLSILAADDPPWIIVSGDGRILRNKTERQVLREANLTFFCMSRQWGRMKIAEYAWKFIKVWPEIVKSAKASISAPKIFEVSGGRGLKVSEIGRTIGPT